MASLKDIAEAAGVSIRTVTRVLKQNGYVSEEARKRVEEVVREIGYHPNLQARSLRTRQSYEVAMVAVSTDTLHVLRLIGIEKVLRQNGYQIDLKFCIKNDPPHEQFVEEILARKPAGAILTTPIGPLLPQVQRLVAAGIPYMCIDHPEDGVDAILIDRQQGVYDSVHHLWKKGRKRIAYVGPKNPNRTEGYERALAELGASPHYLTFPETGFQASFEQARKLGRTFANMDSRPDGVQCFTDYVALGFMAGLHDVGVKVPEDVAVIGFDNRPSAEFAWPTLTTVAQPSGLIGTRTAELLLEKIRGTRPITGDSTETHPTKLILRESA
jgi:DNA-binding LacI/PurR family transcriptional regulator